MDRQLNVEPVELDEQLAWVENRIVATQRQREWLFDRNKTDMELYRQILEEVGVYWAIHASLHRLRQMEEEE